MDPDSDSTLLLVRCAVEFGGIFSGSTSKQVFPLGV